jgi:hypothetical protein
MFMDRLFLALMLTALTSCSGGIDPTIQCPGPDQQLNHRQWEACYGHQEEDAD